MLTKFKALCVCGSLFAGACLASAEYPGEFRPQPVLHPTEKVGATGDKIQPPDMFPVSRAPLVNTARRKPKLAHPGQPTLRGNELVFNAGWEMIPAPRLKGANGATLSAPGVNTRNWYDATVPGTVLTTLVNEGVYPNPYYGLNNLLIPESLNRQDYWYRVQFKLPERFSGRYLALQFKGINYYAEVWFNGHYLGHVTGAFIRGKFDVTRAAKPGGTNVLAVMIAPPPDPGIPSEESVKYGDGDNGGRLCLDGPTFICTEGWDWIPAIRDRDAGIWQDVTLRATGPVTIGDPQVITQLPLPDTAPAYVTVKTGLHNVSDAVERGTLRGWFEGVKFEQPVTLQPGETRTVAFTPKRFPQLTVRHPRLWWPNGYGKPSLYHLHLEFMMDDKTESDHKTVQFGIRELSYELEVKKPDGAHERVVFTPTLAMGSDKPVIDNRRKSMSWGPENAAKRAAAGKKARSMPFWWWPDRAQERTVALWPGQEDSPALKPATDTNMGPYLVIKVNGRRIECLGGDWGLDDAMKRISRARLEPYIRMEHDAHEDMIRNWCGQSTSKAFYDLCDKYGILVWNDFWISTEGYNYNPVNQKLFLRNAADVIRRFRNHPCIAIWCGRNEGVPPEPINEGLDRLVRQLDGTRYYQPNSRLINLRTSGPWSNKPLADYFTNLNEGFSTELGGSSIPSAEEMRSMMPAADLWPPADDWAYHDLHSIGPADRRSTFNRITVRYGKPQNLQDLCRKAQMLNYDTYRAIYEGFNSRLWHNCSGVLVWMSHPAWPSVVMQFYSWDYAPDASLFGAMKGAEPVHIQMNLPGCQIAVINRRFQPLTDVTASAVIYSLSGHPEESRRKTLTAAANACTDVFTLDWPVSGVHFVKLELHNRHGILLSQNFYWHARDEHQLQALNALPQVALSGKWHFRRSARGWVVEGSVLNPTKTPALEVCLTLRAADTGRRILPVYYDDNYFSLLPGESRKFRIETSVTDERPEVGLSGWNIKPATFH